MRNISEKREALAYLKTIGIGVVLAVALFFGWVAIFGV